MGVALFVRIGRRVELTQAGSIFLAEATVILTRVEHAEMLARQAGSGDVGTLRVGFTGSAAFNPAVTAHRRRNASPLRRNILAVAGLSAA